MIEPPGGVNPWHSLWRDRLFGSPYPLIVESHAITPAASLWHGFRFWVHTFRAAGFLPGSRIVTLIPQGAAFIQVLLACLWERFTFIPLTLKQATSNLLSFLDPHLIIGQPSGSEHCGVEVDGAGLPLTELPKPLSTRFVPWAEARCLLSSSGSGGQPRWIALSDLNLRSVIESHSFVSRTDDGSPAIHLSALPWNHAFGLVMDLLIPLLEGAEIVRDPDQGRDIETLTSLARAHPMTHFNTVPLLLEKIRGEDFWQKTLPLLRGGIVGGAPIFSSLAETLRATRLRVGYGLTEASPGLMLGEPGEFTSHFLGRPLGVQVKRGESEELFFRGDNASLGLWTETGAQLSKADDWRSTGDEVREQDGAYWLVGRRDHRIKLPNGTWLPVPEIEESLLCTEPNLHRVALVPLAGGFALCYCGMDKYSASVLEWKNENALAQWQQYLMKIVSVSVEDWPYTAKGETDRRALSNR